MNHTSVIIPVQNEEDTIGQVLEEVTKLQPKEIIIVLNGCTDETKKIANLYPCKIYEYSKPLGNDVGRAIGAFHATGDILLFIDGDIPIPCEALAVFIQSIKQGNDLALNNLIWSATLPIRPHTTTVIKQATNHLLKHSKLSVNSLLAIPHALSRNALQTIGWWNLADPVLAQAIAIDKGLLIQSPFTVDVIHKNKVRPVHLKRSEHSPYPETTNRIIGDHLEAIHYLANEKGIRGGLTEGKRNREIISEILPEKAKKKCRRSAVIPVGEEASTIEGVIDSCFQAGIDEVIVVANGSDKSTIKKAKKKGAKVITFKEALGHNVGRAIGAAYSSGETVLFVDGDFIIPPHDLTPFIHSVEEGTDIALNNLESLLDRFHPIDPISAVKYFLNISLNQPHLLNNSMTAVPFAMRKNVIEGIGYSSLIIPPLAQVRAILHGYAPKAVHYVNVVEPNRRRPEHEIEMGRIPSFDRIFGDHVEALSYYLSKTNSRGGFSDGNRDRELLKQMLKKGYHNEQQ